MVLNLTSMLLKWTWPLFHYCFDSLGILSCVVGLHTNLCVLCSCECEVDAVNVCPLPFRCVQQRRPCFCGRGYNGQRAPSPVQLLTQSSRYEPRDERLRVCMRQQTALSQSLLPNFPACCFLALRKLQGWFTVGAECASLYWSTLNGQKMPLL